MNSRDAIFLHSPELEHYNYPPDNPFNTQRAARARAIAASAGLLSGEGRREVTPQTADRADLERFHLPRYLDVMRSAATGDFDVEVLHMGLGTPDCPIFAGMYDYAALACGATLTGARMILSREAHIAFNPSGGYHHARPASAAGFCYINDAAIACLILAQAGQRVLFLDIDVHHGDAVQDAFYDRRDVMTLSIHESGHTLFPGTGFENEIGVGDGRGFAANLPLPIGTYDEIYVKAFDEVALPLIGAFGPDVIVFEVGMDGLAGDPIGNLNLTNNSYADIVHRVVATGKPLLVTGGGGYHVERTARGWALVWTILCGADDQPDISAGLGGVMLETSEWSGGLRDRALPPEAARRQIVDAEIETSVRALKANLFPLHGLPL